MYGDVRQTQIVEILDKFDKDNDLVENLQNIRIISYSINGKKFSGLVDNLCLSFYREGANLYPKLTIDYRLSNMGVHVLCVYKGTTIVETEYGNFPIEYSLWTGGSKE